VLVLGTLLGGCITQSYQRGYMVPEGALDQIPLGASQEQVLIVLGTPSTVATISGEVFYYISQRTEKNRKVERLANYGIRDGKIFDYISRTTPSGGQEQNALSYLFKMFKFSS
jgi:outer membrane protein assembly factor BamE (lipoprotein component of BamABCDE complex)